MRGNHSKNRRDANEPEIIARLKWNGFQVYRIDQPVDLICARDGCNYLVEVKAEGGRLTPAQTKFFSEWGGCVTILRSAQDVDEWGASLKAAPK